MSVYHENPGRKERTTPATAVVQNYLPTMKVRSAVFILLMVPSELWGHERLPRNNL